MTDNDRFSEWYEDNKESALKDFLSFLSFPSVSTDPSFAGDMAQCQAWLMEYMKGCGLAVEVWETSGYPTLFGSSMKGGKEAPTLLFYGHYDVQPPDPLEEWESPPFEPEVRKGNVYARGAIDNKGQGFYTLLAIRAFLQHAEKENVNIKVLIEGEEEVGSPGLEGILEEKKEKLQADHIFIVDLDMVDEKTPAVTLGIRGVATVNATVKNSVTDLHSGVFGGVVYNPARALSQVVGKMWDDAGRVTIPGFYDTIQPLSDEEKASLDWDRDLKEEGASFNIQVFQGEGDFSLVESNWIRPTLEINGMGSGYMGEGTKTIIPKEAFVKISCRLVAGQDPKQIGKGIETFLKKNLPDDIELKVEMGHGTRGMMTSPHSRAAKEMMKAYEQVFETKCKRQLCGATIPIAPMLEKVCGGELILIGVGLPSDRMHAPNECFSLKRLRQGFLSIAELLISFSRGRTK